MNERAVGRSESAHDAQLVCAAARPERGASLVVPRREWTSRRGRFVSRRARRTRVRVSSEGASGRRHASSTPRISPPSAGATSVVRSDDATIRPGGGGLVPGGRDRAWTTARSARAPRSTAGAHADASTTTTRARALTSVASAPSAEAGTAVGVGALRPEAPGGGAADSCTAAVAAAAGLSR